MNQINLHSKSYKNGILYLGWMLFLTCLFFRSCTGTNGATSVTIPAITKTLPADTVIKHQVVEVSKMIKDRTNEKKLSKDIEEMYDRLKNYQEEINWMQEEFKNSDSVKQAELYRLATELKKFESNFEDDHLKLTINGIIAGNEVKEIKPSYTIKERKIDVPQKQVKFRMLVGGGLGNSITFDKPLFNANIGFQNARGNILRFSFDTEQRIMVGYDFSLFKISR